MARERIPSSPRSRRPQCPHGRGVTVKVGTAYTLSLSRYGGWSVGVVPLPYGSAGRCHTSVRLHEHRRSIVAKYRENGFSGLPDADILLLCGAPADDRTGPFMELIPKHYEAVPAADSTDEKAIIRFRSKVFPGIFSLHMLPGLAAASSGSGPWGVRLADRQAHEKMLRIFEYVS